MKRRCRALTGSFFRLVMKPKLHRGKVGKGACVWRLSPRTLSQHPGAHGAATQMGRTKSLQDSDRRTSTGHFGDMIRPSIAGLLDAGTSCRPRTSIMTLQAGGVGLSCVKDHPNLEQAPAKIATQTEFRYTRKQPEETPKPFPQASRDLASVSAPASQVANLGC